MGLKPITAIFALFLSGLALAHTAFADVYVYELEDGVLNYTNRSPAYERQGKLKKVYRDNDFKPRAPKTKYSTKQKIATTPPNEVNSIVTKTAKSFDVEEALIHAIINTESSYNVRAVSPKGAQGLMQLMPATARRYQVSDVFDPEQNIQGGVRYLRDLLRLFNQDIHLSVAAYNAGEGAVQRYRGIPPFDETREYVRRVLDFYQRYQGS